MSATGSSEGNDGSRVPALPGITGNAVGSSPPVRQDGQVALGAVPVNTAMDVPAKTTVPQGQCVTVGGRTFVYPGPAPVTTPMGAAMAYDLRTAAALEQQESSIRLLYGMQPGVHQANATPQPPTQSTLQPTVSSQQPPQQQQPSPQQQQQAPPPQQQSPPQQQQQQQPQARHAWDTSDPGRVANAPLARAAGVAAASNQPKRQLKWGHEEIHALLVEHNAKKDEFRTDKEGLFQAVAEALLAGPLFGDQARSGAVASGKKVRDKFNNLIKDAKDANKRAQFLSGVRSSAYAETIARELDEAIALENQVAEDKNRLAAGKAATTAFGEQRGNMGAEQAFTGRQECTTLALRPEPKDSKGAPGRPSRRKDPVPAQMGMVDTKEAMTMFMQQSTVRHQAEGDRAEKRIKLEENRFAYEVRKEQREREEREERRNRELKNEASKISIEQERLTKETQFKQDQLAAEKERHSDSHTLAILQENNRAAEAKRAHELQMDAQTKQAESQAQQMKMMLEMIQAALAQKP